MFLARSFYFEHINLRQVDTEGYKGIQGGTGRYRQINGDTGIQRDTGGYRFTAGYRGKQVYSGKKILR